MTRYAIGDIHGGSQTLQALIDQINPKPDDRIYLDNGAFTNQLPAYGNLVALNLDTMQLTIQPWIDRKAKW